ncbi:MAG: carbohydrate ABC transporter substrate-binding protein [Treponema sp.]|nr:carbohydrate ABC transporter substrate-binding protein [Treponema sp.]
MKKSLLALSGVLCAAALLSVSCKGKEQGANGTANAGADANKNLVVWSFTDELEGMINDENFGYKKAHPDMTVEYSLTPTDQFPNKLDPVLASGNGAPDVFALENAFVRKYIEEGPELLLPLDDVYAEVKDKMADYPMQIGSYNGHVYGMAWQVCPGAVFYRRSLAKQILGTDDPAEVQKYMSDLTKFLELAETIKTKTNNTVKIVSTTGDLFMPYKGARKDPWVVNGKLVIDPAMDQYMEMCKVMHDKEYDGRVGQWSEGWFAGMKDALKDDTGKDVKVFSYFLPTWGLHYVLKTNAEGTAGDWAMCQGPAKYYWGGTWIAAYKGTKNPNAAKEMIKYLVSDDGFCEGYAKKTGDTLGNLHTQASIKDTFSEPFLGGQNHYVEFCEMAKGIDGKLIQGTDQAIEALWSEAVAAYANGEKSKEDALNEFKAQVSTTLGF